MPDDLDARLVVLGVDHPHGKEASSAAFGAVTARLPETYQWLLVPV